MSLMHSFHGMLIDAFCLYDGINSGYSSNTYLVVCIVVSGCQSSLKLILRWKKEMPMPMPELLNSCYKLLGCFCEKNKVNQAELNNHMKLFDSHIGGKMETGLFFRALYQDNKRLCNKLDKHFIKRAMKLVKVSWDDFEPKSVVEAVAFAKFLSAICQNTNGRRNVRVSALVMSQIDELGDLKILKIEDMLADFGSLKCQWFCAVFEILVAMCQGSAHDCEVKVQSMFAYEDIIDGAVQQGKQLEEIIAMKDAQVMNEKDPQKKKSRQKSAVAWNRKQRLLFRDLSSVLVRLFDEVYIQTASSNPGLRAKISSGKGVQGTGCFCENLRDRSVKCSCPAHNPNDDNIDNMGNPQTMMGICIKGIKDLITMYEICADKTLQISSTLGGVTQSRFVWDSIIPFIKAYFGAEGRPPPKPIDLRRFAPGKRFVPKDYKFHYTAHTLLENLNKLRNLIKSHPELFDEKQNILLFQTLEKFKEKGEEEYDVFPQLDDFDSNVLHTYRQVFLDGWNQYATDFGG